MTFKRLLGDTAYFPLWLPQELHTSSRKHLIILSLYLNLCNSCNGYSNAQLCINLRTLDCEGHRVQRNSLNFLYSRPYENTSSRDEHRLAETASRDNHGLI